MATLDQLRAQARADVDAIWNDPEARYAMRESFYRRWGQERRRRRRDRARG